MVTYIVNNVNNMLLNHLKATQSIIDTFKDTLYLTSLMYPKLTELEHFFRFLI